MTDRLRRQQTLIGALVLVLAAFTVVQTFYFQHRADSQQSCVERKFSEFSHVSKIRARLGEQETGATRHVLMVYARAAGLVKDKKNQQLTPAQQKKFTAELVRALVSYAHTTADIQRERQRHPVPPYPAGACDLQ